MSTPSVSASASALLPPDSIAVIRRKLRTWSRKHQRHLPWRDESDPYKVWISEIMLQQTTVTAVVPYFARFIAKFPTVETLANAAEADVLKAWEGLGYYSRARNLHRAARQIVSDHAGQMPGTVESLQELPGIGRYTAGAIASFAYDLPAPILEANTLRLYSRLAGFAGDPYTSQGQRVLWEVAEQLVPRSDPGRFNQALMDLGATVCRPEDPDCQRCPLRTVCTAWLEGTVDEIPRAKPRPLVTSLVDVCVVPVVESRASRLLLRRYSNQERWAGLWDFPRLTLCSGGAAEEYQPLTTSRADATRRRSIVDLFDREFGLKLALQDKFHELRHTVTRYRIRLVCYHATVSRRTIRSLQGEWREVTIDGLDDIPLTATGRRIAQHIQTAGIPR